METSPSRWIDEPFTYEDYLHLPDNGKRWEIIRGELFMTPAPTTNHQRASRNLERILDDYVTEHDLGEMFYAPTDVVFSDTDITQPDLLYISKERGRIITEANIQGAPDLIVEIKSPSTKKLDTQLKRRLYARYRVREYWVVDPESKTVDVFVLRGRGYRLYGSYRESDVLETPMFSPLSIAVQQIFAQPSWWKTSK